VNFLFDPVWIMDTLLQYSQAYPPSRNSQKCRRLRSRRARTVGTEEFNIPMVWRYSLFLGVEGSGITARCKPTFSRPWATSSSLRRLVSVRSLETAAGTEEEEGTTIGGTEAAIGKVQVAFRHVKAKHLSA
jgi:hypothetical protein